MSKGKLEKCFYDTKISAEMCLFEAERNAKDKGKVTIERNKRDNKRGKNILAQKSMECFENVFDVTNDIGRLYVGRLVYLSVMRFFLSA